MYEENILALITAIAEDASEEYRTFKTLARNTNKTAMKKYYELRAEETLEFFDSKLFVTAFPNQNEYIKEQLRKEFK